MLRQRMTHDRDGEGACATDPAPGRQGLTARRPLDRRAFLVTTVPEQVGNLIVGRHFGSHYPFGHGLSCTRFEYRDLLRSHDTTVPVDMLRFTGMSGSTHG